MEGSDLGQRRRVPRRKCDRDDAERWFVYRLHRYHWTGQLYVHGLRSRNPDLLQHCYCEFRTVRGTIKPILADSVLSALMIFTTVTTEHTESRGSGNSR